MKKTEVDQFFKHVSRQIKFPVKVYLTGGVASWLMGGYRPTQDIDFSLQCRQKWEEAARIFQQVSCDLDIHIQFSEDISRWGMIGYSRFQRGAKLYKRFGKISVYVLDPMIWSVGKIGRYTADDVRDMEVVFKRKRVRPKKLLKIWAQALLESPRSSAQGLFIKKVEHFLKISGPKIWGKSFRYLVYFDLFRRMIHLEGEKA